MIEIKNKAGKLIKTIIADSLKHVDLSYAYLNHAYLSYADLRYANLKGAVLEGTNLNHAVLKGTNLSYAYLNHADLSYADLRYTNLKGAVLEGTNLKGVDLTGTIGNGKEIITIVIYGHVINYTHDRLQVGCINLSLDEWKSFESISEAFSEEEFELWEKKKGLLFKIIKENPAKD